MGLEPEHWLPILRRQLGVTSRQALSDIGSESYVDLQRFAQKPQDKKALRQFLGIKDESEGTTFMKSNRIKQLEKFQNRHERAKDMLQRLKDQQKEEKNHNDSSVKIAENGIREALQIPMCSWIPHDTFLEMVIGNLETYVSGVNDILKTGELPDVSVVQNASGGLALQGILLSSNLEDQLKNREQLLQAPEEIDLMMPILLQCDEVKVFSCKSEEDRFISSIDTLGYSVTSSAARGFWAFSSEVSSTYTPYDISGNNSHSQKEHYSSIKFTFVPLASCYFDASYLLLSDGAIKELKIIENLITSTKLDSAAVHEQCIQFFHKYGSHANKGYLHFGGKIHQSFPAKASQGARERLSLPMWKSGLVASNSTWSLIDRGTQTVPVWEIIQVKLER